VFKKLSYLTNFKIGYQHSVFIDIIRTFKLLGVLAALREIS